MKKKDLDFVAKINAIYTKIGLLLAISLGIGIISLISLIPSLPQGFRGTTAFIQSILVLSNPKLYIYVGCTMLLLAVLAYAVRTYIKSKYKDFLL